MGLGMKISPNVARQKLDPSTNQPFLDKQPFLEIRKLGHFWQISSRYETAMSKLDSNKRFYFLIQRLIFFCIIPNNNVRFYWKKLYFYIFFSLKTKNGLRPIWSISIVMKWSFLVLPHFSWYNFFPFHIKLKHN